MEEAFSSGRSSLCVPERALRRIFDLINQVRGEYNLPALTFSKELSFMAGEHACNMSTKKVPFGHAGFEERQAQAPLAIAFSENVSTISESSDPGQEIVVGWLQKTTCFSRILSCFTHTGIGIAESETGTWYCCQIFAKYKVKLTKKDELLLITRCVNRIRFKHGMKGLAVSISGTSRLAIFCKQKKQEDPRKFDKRTIQLFFYGCKEADMITELLPSDCQDAVSFFDSKLCENEEYADLICNESYTDIAFIKARTPRGETICTLVVGKGASVYRSIPKYHHKFSTACKCIQLINDYRILHRTEPLLLSHQFCHAAKRHCEKIAKKLIEVEYGTLAKKIANKIEGSDIDIGIYVVPASVDPLRELLLMWINHPKTKARVLSPVKHFGFALCAMNDTTVCAVRILGTKNEIKGDENIMICSEQSTMQYLPLTSDGMESAAEVSKAIEAKLSFKLTG